jgi:hypothetical protein
MSFDNYWKEAFQYDEERKNSMVKILPMNRPAFDETMLVRGIDSVPDMDSAELRRYISINYYSILNGVFNGDSDKYLRCFQNTNFLDAFIDIISERKYFDNDETIRLNNICYDYLTYDRSKRDPKVADKMTIIANIVDRAKMPRLLGLGLSDSAAISLLIARYSNTSIEVVTKRVDFIMTIQPVEVMSKKMIIEIFRVLFNVMEDWIRVFPTIMVDVIPVRREDDPSSRWVTDDIEEIDWAISLAALDILDYLPTEIIRKVLINYSEGMAMMPKPKRFSMNNLSDDYYRIKNVIIGLKNEGIIVP